VTLLTASDHLTAVYRIHGSADAETAAARAHDICLEQTVEFPDDLVEREDIRERIYGQVRSLEPKDGAFEATIDFPAAVAGRELTQLLNVLFGNISLKPGLRLVSFDLPGSLLAHYRGPRFGRPGLRQLLEVPKRPLLGTALKPMGLSPAELAELAHCFARGGIDLIKDDHGLADQRFCPFAERVQRSAEAVLRANEQTGRRCLYLPNVTAPADQVVPRARLAKQAGASGLVISPGLTGLDAMRRLADDDDLALPILSHPALQGSFTVHPHAGLSHGVLYGQLNRLAGADATNFPSYGGRFSFTRKECRDLVRGTERPMGELASIFPAAAGGMSLDKVPELRSFYGNEVVLLIGGDQHRHVTDLVTSCRKFAQLVGGE
jgi:ribulose-bisphosphate carboxylase large chain